MTWLTESMAGQMSQHVKGIICLLCLVGLCAVPLFYALSLGRSDMSLKTRRLLLGGAMIAGAVCLQQMYGWFAFFVSLFIGVCGMWLTTVRDVEEYEQAFKQRDR